MVKLKVHRKDMCILNNYIKNEKGLTLVELLASVILLSIISVFVFSIIIQAIDTNREVQQKTALRDEGDIIVSKFIKTLYSTKQEDIVRTNGKYIEVTNDPTKCTKDDSGNWIEDSTCSATLEKIGFEKINGVTTITFKNEKYSTTNKNVKILEESAINGDPKKDSLYEIQLKLEITQKRGGKETKKQMEFKNQIQPIVNKN